MVKDITEWKYTARYVDIETGEIISKKNAITNYIKIRTSKKLLGVTERNATKIGHIEQTIECRKNRQTKLFDT